MTPVAMPAQGGKISVARATLLGASAVFALLGAVGAAQAKDAVRALITDSDGGVVTQNGAFQTPGTYAIGTIKIDYFVAGYQFPADWTRTLEMCLDTLPNGSRPLTTYPANVYVRQVGTPNVSAVASPDTVTFDNADQEHCIKVDVSVPASVASDPVFQEDGTELVANLQISTDASTKLDTVTTVQLHITLLHPTACVRAIHFVSNHDFTSNLGEAGISVSYNRANARLTSGPVDLQHLLALVNVCDQDVRVDIGTTYNENFELFRSNAVRTTSINQEFSDPSALLLYGLDWNDLNDVSPVSSCLQDVTVPANQAFILSERTRIRSGGHFPGDYAASIGRGITGWSYDGFAFAAHLAGSACSAALSSDVEPNLGAASVPVNEVTLTGEGRTTTTFAP